MANGVTTPASTTLTSCSTPVSIAPGVVATHNVGGAKVLRNSVEQESVTWCFDGLRWAHPQLSPVKLLSLHSCPRCVRCNESRIV